MTVYKTIQGETWDQIALKVYGAEKYAHWLMENNYPLLDILIFSSGTEINVPDLPEEIDEDLPIWKQEEDEESEDVDPYSLGEVWGDG